MPVVSKISCSLWVKFISEVFHKIILGQKNKSTVQAMTFQPFCIGQNSVNSEHISAGKDVLPYGNE
jgi:hypothetical protein